MSTMSAESATLPRVVEQTETKTRRQPRYHVVLLDDNDHTYDYVIRMVEKIFGYTTEKAYELACEVDNSGRVILMTTTREHAELKQEQVHAFGQDPLIPHCKGSMSALVEPAPE
jgi:ATP-dependent Clp protease adaptor protein ClpS